MSRLVAFVVISIFILQGLAACRPFVSYDPDRPTGGPTHSHTVRKGETLFSIAWQYGHDYRAVARWNGIKQPYTIFPGQRINLRPDSYNKTVAANTTSKTPTRYSKKSATTRKSGSNSKVIWRWPAKGRVIGTFSAKDPGKKGLDIAGKPGQSVYAAAKGKVVYSGNGLRGYGNLIIIKHNETYFSAYAHNSRLRVKENQTVKSGQQIADMGKSGTDRVMLHFEIRRNGKPADPLKFLPAKGS